jgi:hypothetical protein
LTSDQNTDTIPTSREIVQDLNLKEIIMKFVIEYKAGRDCVNWARGSTYEYEGAAEAAGRQSYSRYYAWRVVRL